MAAALSLTAASGLAVTGVAARVQTVPGDVLESEFPSRGQAMPVLVVPPTAPGPLTGAAIMMLHGAGGLGADRATFMGPARGWAALGCLVIMPVYFSAAHRAAATDPVAWWSRAVADAAAWMQGLPGIDPGRLGAFGFSRGGYLAAEVAVRETRLKAVVGVASAGNVSPADIVRRPDVLLIHASADPVIPASRTRRWARVLRERGVPVELITLRSPRHIFNEGEWGRIFDEAGAFFLTRLAAVPVTPAAHTS